MLEHRLAKFLAFWTFLLLVVGGAVNATGSSLACPEPTFVCHGTLFPAMTGGVFYEHGHRLWAESVGLLQLALTIVLLRRRPELKALAWIALVMVSIQASLGALTVAVKLSPLVSTGHLLLGMSYFATLIYISFRTAPPRADSERRQRAVRVPGARPWIKLGAAIVFAQLLVGALVRHYGAALVCLGMPTCTIGGDWWPSAAVQDLHMVHRALGVTVGVVTTIAAIQVWRAARGWGGLRRMAMIAPVLVATQITLGIYVVLTWRSVPVAVAHFAGAESLWALWMGMWFLTSPQALASEVREPSLTDPRTAVAS
jgi:heme a synthase